MRRIIALAPTLLFAAGLATPGAQQTASPGITLPNREGSLKFAVIGDSGTGGNSQQRIAARMAAVRAAFPFELTLMLGDNLYGGERPADFESKFSQPYKPLLDAGVKFYASLGNHDDPSQRFYKPFNMNGERYYSFKAPRGSVRFFALDSNYMTREQLAWLENELAASDSEWKICFFHHPIYSSGDRHGSDLVLREQLEPLFVKHGVDVVLTGHEHFYERLKPQKGVNYLIAGSAAKLRRGDVGKSELTAKAFDDGYAFMLMEIAGDRLSFQTMTETGRTVDAGTLQKNVMQTSMTGR